MSSSDPPASNMSLQELGIGPINGESLTHQSGCQLPDGHHSFEDFFMNKILELDNTNIVTASILDITGVPHAEKLQKAVNGGRADLLADIKTLLASHGKKMDQHYNASS